MSTTPSPFSDPAEPIIRNIPNISDDERAQLWDSFHSKNPAELVQHLQPLAIPDEHKQALFQAKQASMPAPTPLDKATQAIQAVAKIDPKVLDLAENHPNTLKVLATAATTESKAPASDSETSESSGKGKKAPEAQKPAKTPLPPRPDGQPHFPPIDPTHHRVLASNGGVYDFPKDRLEDARKIDPLLHVLNPDQ